MVDLALRQEVNLYKTFGCAQDGWMVSRESAIRVTWKSSPEDPSDFTPQTPAIWRGRYSTLATLQRPKIAKTVWVWSGGTWREGSLEAKADGRRRRVASLESELAKLSECPSIFALTNDPLYVAMSALREIAVLAQAAGREDAVSVALRSFKDLKRVGANASVDSKRAR